MRAGKNRKCSTVLKSQQQVIIVQEVCETVIKQKTSQTQSRLLRHRKVKGFQPHSPKNKIFSKLSSVKANVHKTVHPVLLGGDYAAEYLQLKRR